ncbi:imelysin family protein [Epibacterium ulvae]|uniref:imelysin family protein n=1 Tax=Epibacterium ulvae TaxID=1156985 RepID=UPI0024939C3B|nr:imelysin family protein [Epibacterium ulvae]
MWKSYTLALSLALSAPSLMAAPLAPEITKSQIQPAFAALAQRADSLAHRTTTHCLSDPAQMTQAYHDAFDAWIAASHWRFGPTETNTRGFSLAFWPDNRGKTPNAVRALLAKATPETLKPANFADQSVAAKGFYALDFLLFDVDLQGKVPSQNRCDLAQAITHDIARIAAILNTEWQHEFASLMTAPSARYATAAEATQELFKALTTGLQLNDDLRLGRPLGTFDRPRPKRAEAYRSERSLRHLMVSLENLHLLALALAVEAPEVRSTLDRQFYRVISRAARLDDPTLAGVSDPQKRLRIEAVKQGIQDLRSTVATQLGPHLGVSAGFNSLDGD